MFSRPTEEHTPSWYMQRTQGVKEEVDRARTDPKPHLQSRRGGNIRDQRLSIPLPDMGTKQLQTSAMAFPRVLPFLDQSLPPNSSTRPSPEKRFA